MALNVAMATTHDPTNSLRDVSRLITQRDQIRISGAGAVIGLPGAEDAKELAKQVKKELREKAKNLSEAPTGMELATKRAKTTGEPSYFHPTTGAFTHDINSVWHPDGTKTQQASKAMMANYGRLLASVQAQGGKPGTAEGDLREVLNAIKNAQGQAPGAGKDASGRGNGRGDGRGNGRGNNNPNFKWQRGRGGGRGRGFS